MSTEEISIPECPECGEQGCLALAQIGYAALMEARADQDFQAPADDVTDGPQLDYDTVPDSLAAQWRDDLEEAVAMNRATLGLDKEENSDE